MSQQRKTSRLAELCRSGALINNEWDEVAAELLRLHAVELEALELRAKLSQEKEVVAALLAEQDRLQCALNKRHAQVESLQAASVEWSAAYTRGPARQSAPVTAVPALAPLTLKQITDMHKARCTDPDEAPEMYAYMIGIRDAEKYYGIGLAVGDGAQPIKDTP